MPFAYMAQNAAHPIRSQPVIDPLINSAIDMVL